MFLWRCMILKNRIETLQIFTDNVKLSREYLVYLHLVYLHLVYLHLVYLNLVYLHLVYLHLVYLQCKLD